MVHAEDHKLRPVYHVPVADLKGRLEVGICGLPAYLHFIVIGMEGTFVIPVFRPQIRQHKNEGAVVVPIGPLAPLYRGGYELVKFSVPANQELHIFMGTQQVTDLLLQDFFDCKYITDLSVSKKADCKCFRKTIPFATVRT